MDTDHQLTKPPDEVAPHQPVREGRRKAAKSTDQIRPDQQPVPPAHTSLLCQPFLPENHEMGKVELVLMRRRVRAVIETELAVVTLIDDRPMVGGSQVCNLSLILVDTVQQGVE